METKDPSEIEQTQKKDGNNPVKEFLSIAGLLFTNFVNDIPLLIRILLALILVSIIIVIPRLEVFKKILFLHSLNKKKYLIISCIIAVLTGLVLLVKSVYLYRILISLILVYYIYSTIRYLYKHTNQDSLRSKILTVLSIIFSVIIILQLTYIRNLVTYPINAITKMIIGKPIVTEFVIYDRGLLGLYKSSGQGKRLPENGDILEGNFVNGKLNGQGKITYPSGEIWEGNFIDGTLIEGKVSFAGGDISEGTFKNYKLNGQGKITYSNGDVLEGNFIDDKLKGQGKITLANGNIYEGSFDDNQLNGEGKVINTTGEVWEGTFKNNNLNGHGKITNANGFSLEGNFKDNKFIGSE